MIHDLYDDDDDPKLGFLLCLTKLTHNYEILRARARARAMARAGLSFLLTYLFIIRYRRNYFLKVTGMHVLISDW